MTNKYYPGINPKNTLSYQGPLYAFTPCVQYPREPTIHDVDFENLTFWRVGPVASNTNIQTGVEGDLWYKRNTEINGDADWVKLGSGSGALLNIITDAGSSPVNPDINGNITMTGSRVSTTTVGANVIRTDGGTNTVTFDIQEAGSNTSTASATKYGVCQFDSNQFNVTNGFVNLKGTSGQAIQTVTGNSGGVVGPDTNGNINLVGSTNITVAGTPLSNQEQISLTGITNHAVQVGSSTNTLTQVGPNSSTHALFMSQGASADPNFTTTGTPYVSGISFDSGTNVLSTYTQGTWTPVITGSGSNPTNTPSAQNGYYVKIGRMVFATCRWIGTLSGGTGNLQIGPLPFASSATSTNTWFGSGTTNNGTNYLRTVTQILGGGATTIIIFVGDASGINAVQLPQNTYTQFLFSIMYETDT